MTLFVLPRWSCCLLLALLLIQLFPQWVGRDRQDLELRQAPAIGLPALGPVSYSDAVELAAPAVANAVFALTDKPVRSIPIRLA